MADISQGPSRPKQLSVDAQFSNKAEKARKTQQEKVDRGFSQQNSYSSTEGEVEELNSGQQQALKPRMDAPAEGTDKPTIAVYDEIEGVFKHKAGTAEMSDKKMMSVVESLGLSAKEFKENPMAKMIGSMTTNREKLLAQGFSEQTIEGMLVLADPKNPHNNNGLANMHSFSARLNGVVNGDPSLNNAYHLFTDVFNKVANITSIPKNLQKDLQKDLQAFTLRFLGEGKTIDVDEATMMLMRIQTQLQDNRIQFDQENIKIGKIAKEQASEKRMNKILESIEKAKEAKKSGLIGKIFGGIAVAVMAIVAAVMIVGAAFTGGASAIAAAGLMVAATALVIMMMASAETGNWMMKMFGDSKDAMIGAMVFWSAVIVALSLGAAGAGGLAGTGGAAASTASSTAASTTATVTATATNTATTAATSAARVASITSKLAKALQLAGGASMVASGSAEAVSTTQTYEADTFRADAKKLQAEMLRIQQMIDDNIESIQKAIDELQQGYQVISSIMKANHDTKTTLSRNMRA